MWLNLAWGRYNFDLIASYNAMNDIAGDEFYIYLTYLEPRDSVKDVSRNTIKLPYDNKEDRDRDIVLIDESLCVKEIP